MSQAHEVYRSWLAEEGAALVVALDGDRAAPVPSCPGWSITDLTAHVGSFHRWAADLIHDASAAPRILYDLAPDAEEPLPQWYQASLEYLLDAIDATDPDTPMWTVTTDQTAGAWCRRQAHDLAVHRWDAQHARGNTQPIHAEHAEDFLDELFGVFLPYALPFFGRPTPAFSLTLRSADDTYHRRIDTADNRVRLLHDRAVTDVVLTGTPSDLLLALWRRDSAVTVTGDPAAAVAWQQAIGG